MATPKPCRNSELDAIRDVLIGRRVELEATCGERADMATTLRLSDGMGVTVGEVTVYLCALHDESVQDHWMVDHVKSTALHTPASDPGFAEAADIYAAARTGHPHGHSCTECEAARRSAAAIERGEHQT